ncbi:MAG TPA: nicotinate-nucleotide adenylyltransferase [Thermoanaerobaculia bacterium]|nr:nicotinate-nucleotide adenylyltransferase [Thermoanaerobaculia bacterium]
MKIGICGGTFDPFHRGHLDPILAVRDEMEWARIIYIPAWQQPFKADREHASGYHRFAMAVLATIAVDAVSVSPRELERGTISYTVETLELMRHEHPTATLDWIIGDDNIARLRQWKRLDRILELANFVILTRGDAEVTDPALKGRVTAAGKRHTHGSIVMARNRAVPVSSTDIRRRVRTGEGISELVDPQVSRYIQHYGLYREV